MTNLPLLLLAALLARPAQEAAPPPAEPMAVAAPEAVDAPDPAEAVEPAEDLVRVAIDTDKGRIVLDLDRARTPITTAAFLGYVDAGFLEHATFYRAMPYADGGIAQFGVRRTDKLFDPIAHESTADTGILHERGVISLIAPQPGQGRNDWFITLNAIPAFDASADFHGFTPFGRVVEGMEVVEAIFAAPVDPEAGEGPMKGQMLVEPVAITGAERLGDD
ncbi:peptidylprolyl isomerase [Sphingomicrobium astaxanthinifaciens]|uniref:peptidylprolyl isomerase n=1 Tax=Sphingomicrobium astaxanthinifaciens TaxID=1227949 RepID=UPI001FCCB60F|nr:peptidylprolyl isomerase [Sphingomicrobium astaxanthinifaciens]MCJ7421021.1 peptidylprolyl isomerase [Sphingomicrobium astaxanthinifaciens]